MKNTEIYILHSLNGKPYYESIEYLGEKKNLKVKYFESSVFKLLLKDIIKKQFTIYSIERTLKNFYFRLKIPFIKEKTVIFGTAPYDFRIIWYGLLLKKNNLIFHTSHPYWEDDKYMIRKYSFLTILIKKFWLHFLSKKKLKIVTVTKRGYQSLTKNFIINGKIKQIYHSVNLLYFSPIEKSFQNINILYVGKLLQEKGLDEIVELTNKLDENKYQFHIVGDGEYKKKISSIFCKNNVTYYGKINDKIKLSAIYKQCHFLLNLSKKNTKWEELFGIVNIEAMASGLIVIANCHVGPSEIIENNKNGFLFNEGNLNQVVKVIENYSRNIEEYNIISKNAIKRANDFNIKSISKLWENIINE